MNSARLRRFRVIVSVIVLIAFTVVFIDYRGLIPEKVKSAVLFLQFTPSLLKFINLKTIAASGFILVIVLTLLSGRSYCSFLCPLGISQDLLSRIGGRINRRNRKFRYSKPYTVIRYSLLALTVILMLAGSIVLVTLLDPYSIFGRFTTYFGRPVLLLLNNLVAFVLSKAGVYTTAVFSIDIKEFPALLYIIPAAFLALVGYMSIFHGRLYCNTICPVGTFLGFLSKISFSRIRISGDSCSMCGRCSAACKSQCIDFKTAEIDHSRCVVCFNCIDSCNDDAIFYSMKKRSLTGAEKPQGESRRIFVSSAITLAAVTSLKLSGQDPYSYPADTIGGGQQEAGEKKIPVPKLDSTVPEEKTSPVCPPGGVSINHFNDYCTACSICISACPTNVLRPSLREYGLVGIMQPRMDYHRNFCNFECTICIDVCPSGALMPLMLEAKKLTQLGKAKFIEDNCIVKTEKTDCGACSEHCPTKAVKMKPYEGTLVIPEVTDKYCIGCGACEHACPTTPYKAIYVNGNPEHLDAEKPPEEKSEVQGLEEFPF